MSPVFLIARWGVEEADGLRGAFALPWHDLEECVRHGDLHLALVADPLRTAGEDWTADDPDSLVLVSPVKRGTLEVQPDPSVEGMELRRRVENRVRVVAGGRPKHGGGRLGTHVAPVVPAVGAGVVPGGNASTREFLVGEPRRPLVAGLAPAAGVLDFVGDPPGLAVHVSRAVDRHHARHRRGDPAR